MKKILTLLSALVLTAGCSSSAKVVVNTENFRPRLLAVLPVAVPSGIARDRVENLRGSLARELQASGYYVIDASKIESVCTTPACPERSQLAKQYGVDSFVALEMRSVQRSNFVAGYYNSIGGSLSISDPAGKELIRIDHTERERGGLLFNSGQLLQGVRSTIMNVEEDTTDLLGEEFVKALVLKLPRPSTAPQTASATTIALNEVSMRRLGAGLHEICAAGSEGYAATLVLNRVRSPLREVTPGRYCGNFLLSGLVKDDGRFVVELRSPVGGVVERKLESATLAYCDPEGLVHREGPALSFVCDTKAAPDEARDCNEKLLRCENSKLLVYSAPRPDGLYRQIGSTSAGASGAARTWRAPSSKDTQGIYAVVAVSPDGASSLPVTFQ